MAPYSLKDYKRGFPKKADVRERTPDPGVREMIDHLDECGIETCFDRFDKQGTCDFGLAGICCTNCNMGPCRITPRAQQGICGADKDLIVARNLLRALAAGVAGHGARSREVLLALKATARGAMPESLKGEAKIRGTAKAFGLDPAGDLNALAEQIADILLADMARAEPGTHRTLQSLAPPERLDTWADLDIMPIGSYHEVFEALARTGVGTDGDWRNVMQQFLRCGLTFSWNSVTAGAIAQDCLYGPPHRSRIKTDFAALETGTVNVALHGHSPVLASVIVRLADDPAVKAEVEAAGATGLRFYGICCTGLSVLYRQGNVSPLSNAMGAELVLGTGLIDAWIADVQDIYPSIMQVAACFHTTVITTSDSARLPGALHIGFDHTHSNLADVEGLARRILHVAIASFKRRQPEKAFRPKHGFDAEVGFSAENVLQSFGGAAALVDHLRTGRLKGVVNLVGCNNPKVVYEEATVVVAQHLIANDILVLTNGCASFPLLKLGFCTEDALRLSGKSSRSVLEEAGLPPVLHMGECLDNARAAGLFRAVSDAAGLPLKTMPFAFASPEWSNEKGIGAALAFRLLGLDSYHCVFAATLGSENVQRFLEEGTRELLGAVAIVETSPLELASRIVADLERRRAALSG
ncbi:carbon monoxide dehydrogenase [Rhodomicrobium lacus]|uniref:carbon monoxide dehydrogenase n=1 Tax=Rhodomicrobium lacus TaxID=2498452 RepID=UPI000F8D699B|nr:carbon monoxide dehydrogenase [Rhodomicrobium lacus]